MPGSRRTGITGRQPKGVHLTSLDKIVVYGMNRQLNTTDGFLVMPTETLGTHYKAMTYNFGQINLLAIEDNTQIVITYAQRVAFRTPVSLQEYSEKETTYPITLRRGETFAIEANDNSLAGSDIISNKPIAVFT